MNFDFVAWIHEAAATLEASALGAAMRGSAGWYPVVNVAHLGGLVLLVGSIGVLDLRILGFGRKLPPAALSRMLTPIAITGLLLALASGFLLFAADAGPLVRSPRFLAKMTLLLAALLNALLFRRAFGDLERREPPAMARVSALASICLWLTIGALGRLIAYA